MLRWVLFPGEQHLSRPLQPSLQRAGDHAENTRQLNLHRDFRVKHVHHAGDVLTHRPDAECEPIVFPVFAACLTTAGKLAAELCKAALDTTSCFRTTQIVRNVDRDRRCHVPKGGPKPRIVQATLDDHTGLSVRELGVCAEGHHP